MTTLTKYRVYCSTDSQWEETYRTTAPTTCPINAAHSVLSIQDLGKKLPNVVSLTSADSPYTITTLDDSFACDTSGGSITITLPSAAISATRTLSFCKTDDANSLTLSRAGSDLIDAATTKGVTSFLQVTSDGATDWTSATTLSAANTGVRTKDDIGLKGVKNIKINNTATAAPTTGDDIDDGYDAGSQWIDLTNDKAYVCTDPTAGAAVWVEETVVGGEIQNANGNGGGLVVFKQKTGLNLEFKKYAVASGLTVAIDGSDRVFFDVDAAAISGTALLGAPTGDIVGLTETQTLTNKTINESPNNCITHATHINSATTAISISNKPAIGQCLQATSGTAASWANPITTWTTMPSSSVYRLHSTTFAVTNTTNPRTIGALKFTPAAGEYLCMLSCSASHGSAAVTSYIALGDEDSTGESSPVPTLYRGTRRNHGVSGAVSTKDFMACSTTHAMVTCTGTTQVVALAWTSTGTFTITSAHLLLVRVQE